MGKIRLHIFESTPMLPMLWIDVPQNCGLAAATTLRVSEHHGMLALNGVEELELVFEELDSQQLETFQKFDQKTISITERSPVTNRVVNAYLVEVNFVK